MARYEAGETLASIARTYDCSPPAISYIVSRSKARQPEGEGAPAAAPETSLVKLSPAPASAPEAAAAPPAAESPPRAAEAPPPRAAEPPRSAEPPRAAEPPPPRAAEPPPPRAGFEPPKFLLRNGAPRSPAMPQPAALANGEFRRTLHLSLGGQGGDAAANGDAPERPGERHADREFQRRAGPPAPPRGYAYPNAETEAARRKDSATFIDQELRNRVAADIGAFLAAFDAALAGDTQDTRAALREATDRLLRAGARTRIELERLEARVPLAPRDAGRSEPAWRHR